MTEKRKIEGRLHGQWMTTNATVLPYIHTSIKIVSIQIESLALLRILLFESTEAAYLYDCNKVHGIM